MITDNPWHSAIPSALHVAAMIAIGALHAVSAEPPQATAQDERAPRCYPRCEDIGAKNLLRNSSFECGETLWSSLGKPTGWGGDLSGLVGSVESGSAWHGDRCLRIDLGPGLTPVTCFDVWPPACVHQHAPLAANVGWMPVEPGQPLTLSAYLRASTPGLKARFLFRFAGHTLDHVKHVSHEVSLSEEWTRYAIVQEALDADVCIAIGPDATGVPEETLSCWIDAIQLERGADATRFEPRETIELGFSTGRYGHVFEATEPPVLHVSGTNATGDDVAIALTQETEDYFGNALAPQSLAISLPAGGSAAVPWTLDLPGTGYYRTRIRWILGGRERSDTIVYSIIRSYPHEDSPFGLNHPAPSQRLLRQHARAGVRWVRNWSVNWEWVEPQRDDFRWDACDAQLHHVSAAAMKTLVLFPHPSTNWASSAPAALPATRWSRLAYLPREPQQLFHFVTQAVERYQGRCRHWEFLNEPLWVPDFCLPQSAGYTVADYITLLQGAYTAIKAADPESVVIAGLGIQPQFPLGDQFLLEGGLAYCDRLNLHPYGEFTVPEDFIGMMARIQSVMDACGERKPIWATEAGYYAVDDKPWMPWTVPPNHFAAALLLPDERTCADYIVRQALIMFAHGVEKIFYHEPIEGPVNIGAKDIANPFLSPDGVPAKSYAALSALANRIGPSPAYVSHVSFPNETAHPSRRYGYAFQTGRQALLAVWAPDDEAAAPAIALSSDVKAYDVVGNPISSPVILGRSPIYLVSDSRRAHELSTTWFRTD